MEPEEGSLVLEAESGIMEGRQEMCTFEICYASGKVKRYEVEFNPWPTWKMLAALAGAMLAEKGGKIVWFTGPNGLHGSVEA